MASAPIELGAPHQEALPDFILIRTDEVDEGDRLRPVDPVWAKALGQMMARDGQDTPIQVCRLPGRNRWTLVAGAHRLAGAVSANIEHLRAEVVTAERDARRLREVRENLWRSDLTPIDRAAFIAEAVAIYKRRAGIDPARDGRVASVQARWQKQVADEASDTNDTMSFVYGWSSSVADQIGLAKRTIERDLLLYRRLPASAVATLRQARHPILSNASQLRTLAKLDQVTQARVVQTLIGVAGNGRTITSVAQALAIGGGGKPAPDPEAKRLSAFIATFARMSLAERKGALAQLAGMLPAGFALTTPGHDLRAMAALVRDQLDQGKDAGWLIGELEGEHGAVVRFHTGTYELKLCKVTATCAAGHDGLARAWLRAAQRRLEAGQ